MKYVVTLFLVSCGGAQFTSSALELDAGDAGEGLDVAGELYIRHDAGEVLEAAGEPLPPACDLRPCLDDQPHAFGYNCGNGTRYALCCGSADIEHPKGGACGAGATCFCGTCPSSSVDVDAGRCSL